MLRFRTAIGFAIALLGVQLPLTPITAQIVQPPTDKTLCPADLPVAIAAITERPDLARSRWGILVQTLNSGRTLYALEAQQYFTPASNAKLLTTAAALHQLGTQYRIRTSVYGTEASPNLEALWVVGRGDPSLKTAQLQELARQLERRGIRQVQQLLVAEEDGQISGINPTWEWEDVQYYYGTAISPLILNENAVTLTLTPQQPGQPVQLSWDDPIAARQWRTDNRAVTAAAGTPYSIAVSGVLGQSVLHVRGQLAADAEPDPWGLAILDPTRYFLDTFRQVLALEGIDVILFGIKLGTFEFLKLPAGKTAQIQNPKSEGLVWRKPPNVRSPNPKSKIQNGIRQVRANTLPSIDSTFTELAAVESPPLAVLVQEVNQSSNNLYAEALLHVLGAEVKEEATFEAGLTALEEALTELGVDSQSYSLADGSGLSRHNLVSPEAIAQTLQLMARSPEAAVYRASLPVAGMTGTLKNRFRDTAVRGQLRAKTGTLTGVSALSGYLEVPDYQPLVFSILVNQSNQSVATLRQVIDEIVVLLTRLRTC